MQSGDEACAWVFSTSKRIAFHAVISCRAETRHIFDCIEYSKPIAFGAALGNPAY